MFLHYLVKLETTQIGTFPAQLYLQLAAFAESSIWHSNTINADSVFWTAELAERADVSLQRDAGLFAVSCRCQLALIDV